jgi:ammonia channel protein AmtB
VSAGADVYAPTLGYLISALTAVLVVYAGNWIETKMRVDDAVGAVAVHGVAGFLGIFWVGVFAAGYPTGINNVESSIGGQVMGILTFLPLGFLSGWIAAWVLKKLNLLRVPPEVELEGLDLAEYETLVHPEHGIVLEQIVEPDGSLVEASAVYRAETNGAGELPTLRR